MKKDLFQTTLIFMLTAVFIVCSSVLCLYADVSSDGDEEPSSCICGRPYYTEDSDGHEKYDCVNCGKKISNCTCTICWCGAKIIRSTTDAGKLICSGCGHYCENCTCADKATMLNLENERRLGHISAADTPKSTSWISAVVLSVFTLVFFAVFCSSLFVQNRRITLIKAEEAKKQMEEHAEILRKIQDQMSEDDPEKVKERETKAASKALGWKNKDVRIGVKAYELSNAVRFAARKTEKTSWTSLYVINSSIDSENARAKALDGDLGDTAEEAVRGMDFFDNDFYEYAEKCFTDILGKDSGQNSIVHLVNNACNYTLKASAAAPVLKKIADTQLEEYAAQSEIIFKDKRRFDLSVFRNNVGPKNDIASSSVENTDDSNGTGGAEQ